MIPGRCAQPRSGLGGRGTKRWVCLGLRGRYVGSEGCGHESWRKGEGNWDQ